MIAVTGATGHLGHLVVTGLLDAGLPAAEVVAVVRTADRAADLAARGVDVRQAPYTEPAALEAALRGVDRLLLISGSEVGRRVEQHANVLQAAKAAGVALVVYTSAPKADDTPLPLAPEHIATERLIADFGIPAVILRNNWYFENYDQQIRQAAETGVLVGSAGQGRIGAAPPRGLRRRRGRRTDRGGARSRRARGGWRRGVDAGRPGRRRRLCHR